MADIFSKTQEKYMEYEGIYARFIKNEYLATLENSASSPQDIIKIKEKKKKYDDDKRYWMEMMARLFSPSLDSENKPILPFTLTDPSLNDPNLIRVKPVEQVKEEVKEETKQTEKKDDKFALSEDEIKAIKIEVVKKELERRERAEYADKLLDSIIDLKKVEFLNMAAELNKKLQFVNPELFLIMNAGPYPGDVAAMFEITWSNFERTDKIEVKQSIRKIVEDFFKEKNIRVRFNKDSSAFVLSNVNILRKGDTPSIEAINVLKRISRKKTETTKKDE